MVKQLSIATGVLPTKKHRKLLKPGEGDFKEEVLTLDKLAKGLRKQRFAHGAISFERIEVKFEIDEKRKTFKCIFQRIEGCQ